MFRKVIVAVDASGPSMELLNGMDDLLKLGMKELIIVHVIRTETAGIGLSIRREKFLQNIEDKKSEINALGVEVKILQPIGKPSEEIKLVATEEKADLILIGSLGEGSLVRRLFLGSTVTEVIRGTKISVLVEKYAREEGRLMRIPVFQEGKPATALLATDFSRSSLHIFDTFLDQPGIFERLVLFNVIDEGYTEQQLKANTEKAMARLEEWKSEFESKGFEVNIEVVIGVASEHIIEASKRDDISILAISRRGRSMVDELVIGSNADHIVRQSACPVLLLKA
ncbi:MAG: universal stress protein [Bacillota bacterium]|nr:universal stress protein [Bacillota bacterium]